MKTNAFRCMHLISFCVFGLLAATPLQAQLGKGFDRLKDKNYPEAQAAFEQALSDPDDQLAARWGLVQVLAAADYPQHNLDSAWRLATALRSQVAKLKSSKTAKKLSKKYDLTPANVDKVKRDIPKNRWPEIAGKGNLRDLDFYVDSFDKRIPPKFKPLATQQRSLALRNTVASASTYEDLDYLYTRHDKQLRDSFPSQRPRIENAVFSSFMAKNSGDLSKTAVFFKKYPAHPVSTHSTRTAFEESVKANKVPVYLRFLSQNIDSPFAPFVQAEVERLLPQQPLDAATEASLDPDTKALLEDIRNGVATGVRVNCNAKFEGEGLDQWLRYIRRHAPDQCGENALRSIVSYAFETQDWKPASTALAETGALFPADSVWVRQQRALVNSPDNASKPVGIGRGVNTKNGDEYSPSMTPDGRTLVFCARYRTGNGEGGNNIDGEDIFIADWVDSTKTWGKAHIVRELSGFGHQAPLSFSADGNTMILFENGKAYTSARTATGWGTKTKFPVDLSEFDWVSDVHFVPGERAVLFAGRKGASGTDIFLATKNDAGVWSKATRLGAPINSTQEDRSPFVHPDMRTLYFSSRRDGGFGKLDVYKSVRLSDTSWTQWSEPVNLGKGLNNSGDNWGYFVTTDGTTAIFSAESPGGDLEDIYQVELPKEARPDRSVCPVLLEIVDEKGKPLGNTVVEVRNTGTGKVEGSYSTPPNSGKVTVYVPEGDFVTVTPITKGRYSEPVSIDTRQACSEASKGKPVRVQSKEVKEILDTKTTLNADILFDLAKAELKPEANGQLSALAAFAKRENLNIALGGHTDPSGSDADNLALSQARAEAVKVALVAAGVPESKITATGYGETQLLPDCRTPSPECDRRNRRVEVIWKK